MSVQAIHPRKKYNKIVQLELNEISSEVIEAMIRQGKLPNFAKIHRDWAFFKTTSEEVYEHIEPWIQWVTAHTGKTFAEHQIFRLSDVHQLKHTQIWEALSEAGIESAIVGSMNTTRRNTKGGIFFPDPWAQVNEAYPDSLKPFWQLIHDRVNSHATGKINLLDMAKGAQVGLKFGIPLHVYAQMGQQLVSQKFNPKTKWKLASVFDMFLAELFKSVFKTTKFGYYTLFLNAIAHYQHHYWRAFDGEKFDKSISYPDIETNHDPMTHGYEMYDRILGNVLELVANEPDTLVILLSGLSQIPYTDKEAQGGMNYYRLNNHAEFATSIGLQNCEIFPLMSRDWQVKYKDEAARTAALELLNGLMVNDEQLFNVTENTPGYIFIETKYTKGIKPNTPIINAAGHNCCIFDQVFTNIAIKSGHHTGIGNMWISDRQLTETQGTVVPLTSVYNFSLEALGALKTELV